MSEDISLNKQPTSFEGRQSTDSDAVVVEQGLNRSLPAHVMMEIKEEEGNRSTKTTQQTEATDGQYNRTPQPSYNIQEGGSTDEKSSSMASICSSQCSSIDAAFHKTPSVSSMESANSESAGGGSAKKPASMNEIQDLYSALHDLVKTNVTKTPIMERKHLKTSSSTTHSPNTTHRVHERTSTMPEKDLRKLSKFLLLKPASVDGSSISSKEGGATSSADDVPPQPVVLLKQHKRGLSSGTLEMVNNIIRISPFPSRKFSHDAHSALGYEKRTNKKNKTAKKNNNNNNNSNRHSSGSDTHKKWKRSRLFKRFRTKSSPGGVHSDDETIDDDDVLSSSDESVDSPSLLFDKNRRVSEGDALKLRINKQKKTKTRNSSFDINQTRKSSIGDSSITSTEKDIEYGENEVKSPLSVTNPQQVAPPPLTSPELELQNLESWFEQAAAELQSGPCVKTESEPEKLVENPVKQEEDTEGEKNESGKHKVKKIKTRGQIIRRSTSNISRKKEDKKARRVKMMSSKSFDESTLTHAKSTPNLSTGKEELLNNEGENANSKVLGRLSPFTENKLKDNTTKCHSRKISLDGNFTRLPKTPLFYVPNNSADDSCTGGVLGSNLKMVKATTASTTTASKNNEKIHDLKKGGLFYSEEESKKLKNNTDVVAVAVDTVERVKKSNSRNKELSAKKNNIKQRPKSMFDYNIDDAFIDENSMWPVKGGKHPEKTRNSVHLDSGIHTDSNANFCRTDVLNSTHALSMCDLSIKGNNVVQERSLWERFRKGSSSKKSKAIMA